MRVLKVESATVFSTYVEVILNILFWIQEYPCFLHVSGGDY